MRHHLMKEEDMERFCLYCGAGLKNARFASAFLGESHYKHADCKCGRHLSIKVRDFIGSGHDDWDKRRVRRITIEEKIKAVGEKG